MLLCYSKVAHLDVVHDLGLEESLCGVIHDLVAELGLGNVLSQLLDAGALGWWAVLVNDLNKNKTKIQSAPEHRTFVGH